MKFNPLVSIIIPTYNRATKLKDAIESALRQNYKNIQIIVVDDGSKDDTAEVVKRFKDIEYHYQENAGQAAARNAGLRLAKGSVIASLDSDDEWYPEFLERCVYKLEKDNLDFVFANWDQDAKDGKSWDFLTNDPFLKPFKKETQDRWINLEYKELRELYIKSCPSPSSSVVLRKSSMVAGWDEDINIGDDWCLYLDMILAKKCEIAFTLDQLWHKRIDEINIYDGRKWNEILELLFIADINTKINKFKHLLSQDELKTLQDRYMESLVELSKHKLIREFNIPYSVKLLIKSFKIDIPFTLVTIPKIFFVGLKRKVTGLFQKINRHTDAKKR